MHDLRRALWAMIALICVGMPGVAGALVIDDTPQQPLTPSIEYLVVASDSDWSADDFAQEAVRNRLLTVSSEYLRETTEGQPLWIVASLSNPSGSEHWQGLMQFTTPVPLAIRVWENGRNRDDSLFTSVRGPSYPVQLAPGESKEWLFRVDDSQRVNLGLALESPVEFNRRNQQLSAYLFTIIGAIFLGSIGLMARQYRWHRRHDTSFGVRWIFWPGYLLFLVGFSLFHYLGPAISSTISSEVLDGLSSAFLGAAAFFLGVIWWGRTGHYPLRLVALIVLGLTISAALGALLGSVTVLIILLVMSILRLINFGMQMRTNLPLHAVAAPLSLLVWSLLELFQHSPLAFISDAQSPVLLTLMGLHALFVHLGFFPPRKDAERLSTSPTSGLQSANVLALLRKLNHDLRSPIHGVLGMTTLLSETNLNINQQEYVATTHNAGIQMLNLADEMRALTRIFNDRIQIRPRSTELHEFLHDVVSPFARLASQKSVEVITEVLSDVPNHVQIDPDLVSQVLRIILDNSVKFTEEGVIQVAIRLESPQRLRIRIDDTGAGVPEQEIGRLFEFQSTAGADESGQHGMRLGLPIASELVKAMSGQLGVSRAAGKGSSFWISLPFDAETETRQSTDPDTLAPLLQQKVMIVDDHLAVRKVLEDQTHNWGMQPELASSGKEALAILQSHMFFHQPFDWVIIDYRMPEMNGLELLEKIRATDGLSHLRCIVMTGIDLHYVEQAADNLGVVAVMAKPVNNRELLKLLSEHA